MDKSLTTAGFKKIDDVVKHRLVVCAYAREKQGKTHFSLTAPDPIAYFGLDIGHEGVVQKFTKDKTIYTPDEGIKLPTVVEMATDGPKIDVQAIWDKYKKATIAAFQSPEIRTVVWDTATEAWELLRLARFGRLTQVMPVQYGPVNAEMRGLLRIAFDSSKNFILLHKMKAEYINDKRTGGWEVAGFSDAKYIAQCNVELFHDKDTGEFGMRVDSCRQNMGVSGEEFRDSMCSFPFLASMVFGTGTEEWE